MGRVLVLGAQGAAGTAVTRAFAEAGWETLGAGRRPGAQVRVDLDEPETLVSAMETVDMVLNTVPHPGLTAERTVLKHGGLLINVADRSPEERRTLRGIADPRGRVLLNWGVIPGTVALAAAELLEDQPEADGVELAATFSAAATSGAAGGEFLRRELGRKSSHATRVIPFPPPLGPRRCIGIAEGQNGWLGAVSDGREVSTYMRFTDPGLTSVLLLLNRLGLMRRLPAPAFRVGRKGSPKRLSGEDFCVWVAIYGSGRRLGATAIQGSGMYRCTGAAAVAAAEYLDAEALPAGCLDPKEALSLTALRPALSARGLAVQRVH